MKILWIGFKTNLKYFYAALLIISKCKNAIVGPPACLLKIQVNLDLNCFRLNRGFTEPNKGFNPGLAVIEMSQIVCPLHFNLLSKGR